MTPLDFSLESLMVQLEQASPLSHRQHRHLNENVVLNKEKGVVKRLDTLPTLSDSSGTVDQSLLEASVNRRNRQETGKPENDTLFTVPDAQMSQVSVLSVTSKKDSLEHDPQSDTGWSTLWRERVQGRLQRLENWVNSWQYDRMRDANNALPVARRRTARAALMRWYFSPLEREVKPSPTLGLVACFEQPIHLVKLLASLERAHIPSEYSRTDDPLPHRLSSTHPGAFSVAQSLNLTHCSLETP